jgi:hypothetical protein
MSFVFLWLAAHQSLVWVLAFGFGFYWQCSRNEKKLVRELREQDRELLRLRKREADVKVCPECWGRNGHYPACNSPAALAILASSSRSVACGSPKKS